MRSAPTTQVLSRPTVERPATRRRYVMCRPTHYTVRYAINPWMDPAAVVDADLATAQWERLRQVYLDLGHEVEELAPHPAMPDMVFAANGGLVIGDRALGARFTHAERAREAELHRERFAAAGIGRIGRAEHLNEGEGDFLVVGRTILAGTGFRTSPRAHAEAAVFFGRPVVSLELVDPRFYHLDVALAVLGVDDIAYYPPAFSAASRTVLERSYPDAVIATEADALALGLNAVSDGRHVVLAAQAHGLATQLAERGYLPIGVDLSELVKAGGNVKCCTMEVHP